MSIKRIKIQNKRTEENISIHIDLINNAIYECALEYLMKIIEKSKIEGMEENKEEGFAIKLLNKLIVKKRVKFNDCDREQTEFSIFLNSIIEEDENNATIAFLYDNLILNPEGYKPILLTSKQWFYVMTFVLKYINSEENKKEHVIEFNKSTNKNSFSLIEDGDEFYVFKDMNDIDYSFEDMPLSLFMKNENFKINLERILFAHKDKKIEDLLSYIVFDGFNYGDDYIRISRQEETDIIDRKCKKYSDENEKEFKVEDGYSIIDIIYIDNDCII